MLQLKSTATKEIARLFKKFLEFSSFRSSTSDVGTDTTLSINKRTNMGVSAQTLLLEAFGQQVQFDKKRMGAVCVELARRWPSGVIRVKRCSFYCQSIQLASKLIPQCHPWMTSLVCIPCFKSWVMCQES